ncbi:MAG: hypothetical protein ACMUIU_12810 [bacterium]
MYGIKNLMNIFHKKTSKKFTGFYSAQKSYRILTFLILMAICLVFFTVSLPNYANAGTVYGHIHCSRSMQCPQRITFSIYSGRDLIKRLSTDNNRDYTVFLAPGQYTVKIDLRGGSWEANIRSSSNPIRQDIYPIRVNGR